MPKDLTPESWAASYGYRRLVFAMKFRDSFWTRLLEEIHEFAPPDPLDNDAWCELMAEMNGMAVASIEREIDQDFTSEFEYYIKPRTEGRSPSMVLAPECQGF